MAVYIKLATPFWDALYELSVKERRNVRDQAVILIEDSLKARGLLPLDIKLESEHGG